MNDEELRKLNISFCSNESIDTEVDINISNGRPIENECLSTDETINNLFISFDESNEFQKLETTNSPILEQKGITEYFMSNFYMAQSRY